MTTMMIWARLLICAVNTNTHSYYYLSISIAGSSYMIGKPYTIHTTCTKWHQIHIRTHTCTHIQVRTWRNNDGHWKLYNFIVARYQHESREYVFIFLSNVQRCVCACVFYFLTLAIILFSVTNYTFFFTCDSHQLWKRAQNFVLQYFVFGNL